MIIHSILTSHDNYEHSCGACFKHGKHDPGALAVPLLCLYVIIITHYQSNNRF